jgi:hypothetical protein
MRYQRLLCMPDDKLLEYMSTSPDHEPAWFVHGGLVLGGEELVVSQHAVGCDTPAVGLCAWHGGRRLRAESRWVLLLLLLLLLLCLCRHAQHDGVAAGSAGAGLPGTAGGKQHAQVPLEWQLLAAGVCWRASSSSCSSS